MAVLKYSALRKPRAVFLTHWIDSLGLGLPFLVTAVLLTTTFEALRSLSRYAGAVETASGVFLVVMGGALLFDLVFRLNAWILQIFPLRPTL